MSNHRADEHLGKNGDKIYVLCKYNCNTPIEESKLSSHLHVCPNKPKSNEILDIICAPDPNECYISSGQWPSNYPHTKEVFDLILRLGHKPPFDILPENQWIDVQPRVKKNRDVEPKQRLTRRK